MINNQHPRTIPVVVCAPTAPPSPPRDTKAGMAESPAPNTEVPRRPNPWPEPVIKNDK